MIQKRKILACALKVSIAALLCCVAMARAAERGDVVLQQNFERADVLLTYNVGAGPQIQLTPGKNGQAVQMECKTGASTMLNIELPAEKLRGARILIEGAVKAENVSAPPQPWNGVKMMLHTNGPSGDTWPQAPIDEGTYDWKPVRFIAKVPEDAQKATLALGLELVSGKVWFDDIKVTVVAVPHPRPNPPLTGPRYQGHNLPRLRGAMISTNITPDDLRVLAKWGANHVRWQLTWNGFPKSPADNSEIDAYNVWLESALKHLDEMLPLCRELGIHVLLDIHTPPGGRNANSECRMFKEKPFQDAFEQNWEKIARRYKGEKIIWGYDLVNEPVEGEIPDGVPDWRALALSTAKRVLAIDPDHAIIIEAAPWGGPDALVEFEPLPLPNIVYSFHMYLPHEFTHQGVIGDKTGVVYPGQIGGKVWDKTMIRKTLQPVVEWQRDYNVNLYVGEFSAIRWAPGDSARDYLRDCIDVFEANGWDWAYHAFREWPGWSVEHTGDKDHTQFSPTPTSRQQLLMDWFAKNKH